MVNTNDLPALGSWEGTRDSLQAYARVLGAIRGDLVEPHPQWWHISLQPEAKGLTTGDISSQKPDAKRISARIDLELTEHVAVLHAGQATQTSARLGEVTPTELGDWLLKGLTEIGFEAEPPVEKWQNDQPQPYAPDEADRYLGSLTAVAEVFSLIRENLPGKVSPVQLWPHHFDLSFEWFGERTIVHEEHAETREAPSQIGFGFSTGDEGHPGAYFYANPWPFDEALLRHELPGAARWNTEGWQGSLLPYDAVATQTGLATYLQRVFELASPDLS